MSLWGTGAGQLGDRAPRKPPRVLHQPTALNNQEAELANNTNKVRDERWKYQLNIIINMEGGSVALI